MLSNWTTNTATTAGALTLPELLRAMKQANKIADAQRARREEALESLRKQGYFAIAIDCGMGETWVVDDRIIDHLRETIETATDGCLPIAEKYTGIRLIRASEWKPPMEPVSCSEIFNA